MSAIAVSIFIKQVGDKVSISSLSTNDVVARSIERMLCEQAEHVIQFVSASYVCVDELVKHKADVPSQHQSTPVDRQK